MTVPADTLAADPGLSIMSLPARGRKKEALHRAHLCRSSLARCKLCSHQCGVNRLAGERGPCRAGVQGTIFSAQTEVSDELDLIPTFAIAFGGCDLRCSFCITGRQSWDPHSGNSLDVHELATKAQKAIAQGARSVMILGGEPTIHLPDALEMIAALPEDVPIIWKTNGMASAEGRAWLEGMADIWLVDFKFGNDLCAARLARAENYRQVVESNLLWAHERNRLIVRHLAMPGHVECCWLPVATWLHQNLPNVEVNLRTGFWPAWQASRHAEFRVPLSKAEGERVCEIAQQAQLHLME